MPESTTAQRMSCPNAPNALRAASALTVAIDRSVRRLDLEVRPDPVERRLRLLLVARAPGLLAILPDQLPDQIAAQPAEHVLPGHVGLAAVDALIPGIDPVRPRPGRDQLADALLRLVAAAG